MQRDHEFLVARFVQLLFIERVAGRKSPQAGGKGSVEVDLKLAAVGRPNARGLTVGKDDDYANRGHGLAGLVQYPSRQTTLCEKRRGEPTRKNTDPNKTRRQEESPVSSHCEIDSSVARRAHSAILPRMANGIGLFCQGEDPDVGIASCRAARARHSTGRRLLPGCHEYEGRM